MYTGKRRTVKTMREHFVTCGQMKILEQRADADGLSYYRMMENAGTRAAEIIMERISGSCSGEDDFDMKSRLEVAEDNFRGGELSVSHEAGRSALVFCGKGNNGGDGFVAARRMMEAGYSVTVILVDGEPVTEDSITNFGLIRDRLEIVDMNDDERALMQIRQDPDVIVDAIYGTGFRGRLAGSGLKAAICINKQHAEKGTEVAALDIPSGLGGDLTNEKDLEVNSVRADYTITFHARKPVHLQKFAAAYCGETIVADIGIDEERLWNVEM